MIKFNVVKANLKKALSIVSQAIGDSSIKSHTLFDVKDEEVTLYSTDDDKIALAKIPISDTEISASITQFTADPKKLKALLSSSTSDSIKFEFDETTSTLNIYASENSKAHISFASFDPSQFLMFDLSDTTEIKSVDSSVFLTGVKFTQGFLTDDVRDKKYSNLFILNGVIYGANGSNKIGAFKNDELNGINSLVLRKSMLPSILNTIYELDLSKVIIKETSKFILFSSEDDSFCFGFRKSSIEIPKLPISLEIPNTDSFNIDKPTMIKKLNRLSLTWDEKNMKERDGLKIDIKDNELSMQTITDRKSMECMPCKRLQGEQPLEFIIECNRFKSALNLFLASNVDVYVDNIKCTIFSAADMLIEEKDKEPIKKPFTAVGLLTLARVV